MRAALAVCLVLLAACSGPIAQPSAKANPLPPKLASGGVVEYPVPNPSLPGSGCSGCGTASLSGIAAGPDGNVWYFDVGQNLVGRVTPSGSITQFSVPATGAGSEGIVGAPDGNVWMVARGSMKGPDWILKVSPGRSHHHALGSNANQQLQPYNRYSVTSPLIVIRAIDSAS